MYQRQHDCDGDSEGPMFCALKTREAEALGSQILRESQDTLLADVSFFKLLLSRYLFFLEILFKYSLKILFEKY